MIAISRIKTLVYSGLMVALVFVTTFSIKVPVPFTQGYIHMGDSMIFVASILFGWKVGALAGGVGSMLADIVGGYAGWAVPTLIIKSVMGIIVALVAAEYKKKKTAKGIISLLSMGAWVAFGVTLNTILKSVLADSTNAQKLAGQLELSTVQELQSTAGSVSTGIIIGISLIPVCMFLLWLFLRRKDSTMVTFSHLLGMTVAGMWMVAGYYFAERIMFGNWLIPIFALPMNILQFVGGMIIAFIIVTGLRKRKAL